MTIKPTLELTIKINVSLVSLILTIMSVFTVSPVLASTYQISLEISIPAEDTEGTGMTKAYNKLVLGTASEATDGYDPQWDTPAFFTTPDSENPTRLKAYIRHPEYAENRRELWRDIRSDAGNSRKAWSVEIALAPSEIGQIVTVSWTLPPSVVSSKDQVTLTDPGTNTSVDMRTQAAYRFVNGSTASKTLSVTVAPPSGSSDKGSSGLFGCGVVKFADPGPPDSGATAGAAVLNLLILISPILMRFRPWRTTTNKLFT